MSPSDRPHAARKATGEPKIALAVDLYDWHARDLSAAFARAGAIAVPIRLSQCSFDTRRRSGLVIPGFGADLPDAMFVRAVGSGSFESVTLRLDVLHSLGALGVPVLNSARTVEICVDKAATSFALARNSIPTPATWTVQSEQAARQVVRREAGRGLLVLKPLFGAQGYGLKLIGAKTICRRSRPWMASIICNDLARSKATAFVLADHRRRHLPARIIAKLVGSGTGEGGYAQALVRYAIIALFTAIGLTFMGLADQIVMIAFGLIFGLAAMACALAFGLGGRDAAARASIDGATNWRADVPPPRSAAARRAEGRGRKPAASGMSLMG